MNNLSLRLLLFILPMMSGSAFTVHPQQTTLRTTTTSTTTSTPSSSSLNMGYLDDMNKYVGTAEEEEEEDDSREATAMAKDKQDRFGVGDWSSYVEFNEFDGGDGQMGVAGDGNKGLEKEWSKSGEMAKSKLRSARNAWGTSSGYADQLIAKGVEAQRAQQLENWHNQQEVLTTKRQARFMTDDFDKVSTDEENWRNLAKFGVERNQDFDMDQVFGAVQPGNKLEADIQLQSRLNRNEVYEFKLKNNFMGFSDFRAAFTPNNGDWIVEPSEGSLSGREATDFVVKFRPINVGITETYLVIDTEDDKWTWKFTGSGSM